MKKHGQSLMEAVLALAIFSLIAASLSSLSLGGVTGLTQANDALTASLLASEGAETVRATRDRAWNELLSGQTSETLGKFIRSISLAGSDLHSKEVRVEVEWSPRMGATTTAERATHLTNWDSQDWVSTDWSGGAGQRFWVIANQYFNDDGGVEVGTIGEVKLKAAPPSFSTMTSPVTQILNSIHCRSVNDCWAVGNWLNTGPAASQGEIILHWDGNNWTRLAPSAALPNTNLNSVFCLPAGDCWAVGNQSGGEVILRNTSGLGWTRYPISSIPNVDLYDIFCVNANYCWAVGANSGGELTIRWNGSAWSRVGPSATAPNVNLNSVFCLSTTDCWAAGASGAIVRFTGTSWSLSIDTGSQTWNGIHFPAASSGFVVGSGGEIRQWNGSNWSTTYDTGSQTWNEVEMWSASDGLVVGSGGAAYRFNAAAWNPMITSTTQNLNSLIFLTPPPRAGFVVGFAGTILELVGGGYMSAGNLISSAFNFGDESPVQIIEWSETIPVCSPTACSIRLQVRVAPDAGGTPGAWSSWFGSSGAGSFFTLASGELIPPALNGREWGQFQVWLEGNGLATPILHEVKLNYK